MLKPKKWTVLLYMAADGQTDVERDTEIAYAALADLKELRAEGSNEDVDIGVHLDLSLSRPVRFAIGPGGGLIAQKMLDESSTGNPEILASFLTWAQEEVAAEKYLLVLWGHGLGIGHALVITESSADVAQEGQDGLSAAELAGVLGAFKEQRGGKPLEILGFNSCFMSGVEIAFELRGLVDRILGTQDLEPLAGWPYGRVLRRLKEHAEATPAEVSAMVTEEVIQSFKPADRVTQTALNPAAAVAVADAMRDLVATLRADSPERRAAAGRILRRAKYLGAREFVDLRDLCRRLRDESDNPGTRSAAEKVIQTLLPGANHFITNHNRRGAETEHLNGVSIYFRRVPRLKSGDVTLSLGDYQKLGFVSHTEWETFVSELPEVHPES
jgi:cysteine peptidase C11 family protein